MKLQHSIISTLLLPAAFACSSDKLLMLKETTETSLGPRGGNAKSADQKLELNFPLGALKEDTVIRIDTIRDGAEIPRAVEKVRYELSPHGMVFDREVFITIHAQPQNPDDLVAIANVDGAFPEVLESSVWDSQNKFARATLNHFSAYTAVTVYNPCGGKDCGDPCTICDPLNTTCTEPPPVLKACNRSGLCVDETVAMCPQLPDTGVQDTGEVDSGDPDSGVEDPDSGEPNDSGVEDTGTVSCAETFEQNAQPVVDILLIIDNSCSMYEEQSYLASSFALLHDTLVQNNVDFHVGITSTDPMVSGGMLLGTPTILSSSTPNLAQVFATNVVLGVDGSGLEEGLEAAQLALTAPANPGFLRDNSSLTVIYVSDEEDYSASSTTAYASFLLNLRGARRVQANAVIGPAPSGCTGQHGTADVGSRYDAVRVATGGAYDPICASPWPNALTDLGRPGYGYVYQFTLSAPAASVSEVRVDGVPVPATDWSYDPATQTIEFIESATPGPGAVIEVDGDC